MSRGDALRLEDIRDAAGEMIAVVEVGREQFLADPIRLRAAERLLEFVGEAANALSMEAMNEYSGVDWRQIRRLRIVPAHHYQRVDPEQVWIMATVDLPALVRELDQDH